MKGIWPAVRIGLLDMRGDIRRFVLLVVCLAVGTALIAGVSSVGESIRQTVDKSAAEIMGGDIEVARADRVATPEELAALSAFGKVAAVVDTNLRAEAGDKQAFVDLIAAGPNYPLLGQVQSPQLPAGTSAADFLGVRENAFGALLDPVMLDQLGIGVGDQFDLGGTTFEVRGTLGGVPDGAVRGFRLGLPTLISTAGFAAVSDRTSPLPGLGSWFRYKLLLNAGAAEEARDDVAAALNDSAWTVRTARDALGPMVRYYDLFMRFLVIVGLGSLLIGGVSVWTSMQAYILERAKVIAVLRSIGADEARIFVHFISQVVVLAALAVLVGILIGGGAAYIILPIVGQAVGIALPPQLHPVPLLVAAGTGLLTAFTFSYLPLQQVSGIRPAQLFRAPGTAASTLTLRALFLSWRVVPPVLSAVLFFWLAYLITNDALLVLAFAVASAVSALVLQLFVRLVQWLLRRAGEPPTQTLRHAVRAIASGGSNAAAVVVSVGMALAMLIVVLVLQANLRQEFLGASAFDVPTFVASDLFPDELETLRSMATPGGRISDLTALPMLRGAVTAINGTPIAQIRTRGPEASFLLAGEVPLTFRSVQPASSRLVAGTWWPDDYQGPPLLSLHQSLRAGLGVNVGDTVTFNIFGETVTAEVANFRDYSWQGGIDFLATFSPGVLDPFPTTLFTAVTAAPGQDAALERDLAAALPDVRFIAIGDTLEQVTEALSRLSFAAALVGGLAVGNGLLVVIGSLAAGLKQRQADAVITKVLGGTRLQLLRTALVQYFVLAILAVVPAAIMGLGLGWVLSSILLDVEFTVDASGLLLVLVVAALITAAMGALTILRPASAAPARLLREL